MPKEEWRLLVVLCVLILNIGWGARSTIYEEDWEDETYKI